MSKATLLMPVLVSVCLCAMGPAQAQTTAPQTAAVPATSTVTPVVTTTTAPASDLKTDRRIERIHIEDAGSSIDELRVGGETQSITVAPKGGMPAYEVIPNTGNRSPATAERGNTGASGGTRVWKILGF